MAKPFGVWGIDIGQCALKAIRLEMIDNLPTATAFDYIEHPKILSQPDADPDALTRESLEKFLSRNPIGKDQVAVGIAGQSGLARFVKLPPVEEKKITDIVKFEAKQQIPFPLEEVVWDFQKIAGGETVGGFAMETEIGLFAMKRDIINKYLGHFTSVGAEVHFVQMAPLALCNFATYELLKKGGPDGVEGELPLGEGEEETPRGKRRCTVVLDIGTDSSNLIITDGGKIIWQRPIPLGGNHFTRALTKELKLTFAKAEHLKRNAAKSPELAQILKALRPVLTEFVGEVQRSLGYFTNTHRDAHVAYMVGLGSAFKLPGLQKYLSEKLSLDVRKPSKFQRMSGDTVLNDPTFTENILTYPVAYGLALQGLGLARLQTSLLPSEVRVERMIRAKKPAVAFAAAAFLLGTGFMAIGLGSQLSSVTDPEIAKAMEKTSTAIKQSKSQDDERANKEKEIADTQAEVKAIIVGNDERLNWIRVNEVLVAALPRHGYYDDKGREIAGTNLLQQDQIQFWNTNEGKRAFEKYKDRMSAGIPVEKLFDDDLSQHLAQVNLESVYCRYSTDVGAFLTAADDRASKRFGINIADDLLEDEREKDESTGRFKPKAPAAEQNGGWIFELRGYTYHAGGTNFLRRCMIRNLRGMDLFADSTGAKKVSEIIPGGTDPVKKNVNRVFLLLSQADSNPQPGAFKYIGQRWIDELMAPAQGGAAGPGAEGGSRGTEGGAPGGSMMGLNQPGAGVPGAGGGNTGAGSWTPLGSSGSSSGGFGAGLGPSGPGSFGAEGGSRGSSGGGPASPPGMPAPPGGSGSGLGPTPGSGVGSGPALTPTGKKPKTRYEFVICFVWREPTPTDPTPTASSTTGQ